ncbi:WD40-repeat-containing domain protein [Mucor mucedo]|uniref:WD40-repeat-containing domain protein n=1 Tax=Mucor mucedo TaxID=29922 RepID=UPI00221FBA87|nr:WD40-repeat-containing domain protein [Mucor mucedo]KAI7886883.1 WD40-repeat-containing domain protein [Mucor mucedo]
MIYQFIFPDREFCTPFQCDFSHRAYDGHLLAIGDEEGRLSLLRTDMDNDVRNQEHHVSFYCHKQTISDVKWSADDSMLLTSSHDRVIRLWDSETRTSLAEFSGHTDVVKSVNWHPTNEHLIITGSKDGSFSIWDTRYQQKKTENMDDALSIPVYSPICNVAAAHNDVKTVTKTLSRSGVRPLFIRSVTCAVFSGNDENRVVTSGSVDGSIKLWDVRAGRTAKAIESTIFENESGKRHGITDMKVDRSGTRLFSSCMDNSVYMHYLSDLTKPARKFVDKDYKVGSFDIRIALSPNDEFLLSGSHDQDLFVWDVEGTSNKAYQYQGHSKKVTGVTWSKRHLNQFASCSEDFTARIWNLER